jgi:opacity protein-like surface antigen
LIYDDSAIREGNLYDFELGVSKRLSLATTGFLTWRYLQRQATTGKVYDMTTSEYLIGAERLLTSRLTAFIEYRFRDGDQVSSASPHNINTVTDASWKDSAFEACDEHGCWPLYAYRTEGESHHLAAGAAYKLDDAINIELGVSYLDAESDASLSYRSWSFRLALTYHIKP